MMLRPKTRGPFRTLVLSFTGEPWPVKERKRVLPALHGIIDMTLTLGVTIEVKMGVLVAKPMLNIPFTQGVEYPLISE